MSQLLPRLSHDFESGRRGRRLIAAALGHDDFESESDSKSELFALLSSSQFTARCAAVVAACGLALGVFSYAKDLPLTSRQLFS